jgi:hypothetical protein
VALTLYLGVQPAEWTAFRLLRAIAANVSHLRCKEGDPRTNATLLTGCVSILLVVALRPPRVVLDQNLFSSSTLVLRAITRVWQSLN